MWSNMKHYNFFKNLHRDHPVPTMFRIQFYWYLTTNTTTTSIPGSNLIVTPPMNATVLEGDRAEFECYPKSPEAIVQWYKDGSPIGDIPELAARAELASNGSFIIRKAASTDPGEYECHVQDTDGLVQSTSAFLDVQCE